jgi:hypothetical protein
MLHQLRRHPIPIRAFFRSSLVLTYAFPAELLKPLLPPGLKLYQFGELGFLAIALVETESLRPAFLPRFVGCDFFLAGFRIFTQFRTASGRTLKGLRILRSYADRELMVRGGNLLTHYGYRLAQVSVSRNSNRLEIEMNTTDGAGDLSVVGDLSSIPAPLPDRTPFRNEAEARRFAGPLPFTFDYEPETHSIIVVEGVRQNWHPKPIQVEVKKMNFLREMPFCQEATPLLANAFYVEEIPYRWKRGVAHRLNHDGS